MRILGIFLFYLRIHDNMFTVLGGFRVSPNKNHSAVSVYPFFSAGDLSRYLRGCGVHPN